MTKQKLFAMFAMIMAVASIGLGVYLFMSYETLLETFLPETLDRILLVSVSMSLVYLSMGIAVLTDFKSGTQYAVILSFIIFLLSIMY